MKKQKRREGKWPTLGHTAHEYKGRNWNPGSLVTECARTPSTHPPCLGRRMSSRAQAPCHHSHQYHHHRHYHESLARWARPSPTGCALGHPRMGAWSLRFLQQTQSFREGPSEKIPKRAKIHNKGRIPGVFRHPEASPQPLCLSSSLILKLTPSWKNRGLGIKRHDWILALPLPHCVILGQSLPFSGPLT